MMASAPASLLHQVWEYPLFDALFGRRSRRFGMGFEMTDGPFKYKSQHEPLPLSEVEEAMLAAAGVGFSGMALWDQNRPLPFRGGDGRTFPSTSRGRRTALFITNDQGVYVIDPAAPATSKLRAVEGANQREQALSLYRENRKTLRQGRLDIPRRVPPLSGHNLFEYARFNALHAGVRRELYPDWADSPIRRSTARTVCPEGWPWNEYRRRPLRISAGWN